MNSITIFEIFYKDSDCIKGLIISVSKNMRYFSFLLLSVVMINIFYLQNFVIGRYILVKLDQQALASPKLEDGKSITLKLQYPKQVSSLDTYCYIQCCFKLDLQEKIACLKEEGIPDECLSFFNTGLGYDKCQEKLNEPHASEFETASKNCIGVSNTER